MIVRHMDSTWRP